MMKVKGFTLIELLVVIAIIGLLSAVIIAPIQSSRAKARDARKIADLRSLQTALYRYFDDTGVMLSNVTLGYEIQEGSASYNTSLQRLVDGGYLPSIPRSPGGSFANGGYAYYDYGAGNAIGGIWVTTLETIPSGTTPTGASCRPFTNNWCSSTISSRYYCLCSPY